MSMIASKLRVTGFCEGNSRVTGEFPAQKASKAENSSTWWRHHMVGCGCGGDGCGANGDTDGDDSDGNGGDFH